MVLYCQNATVRTGWLGRSSIDGEEGLDWWFLVYDWIIWGYRKRLEGGMLLLLPENIKVCFDGMEKSRTMES